MNLLFDLDGTLTDPQLGIVSCIRHALERLDRNPDNHPNLERYIGPPLLSSFEEMLGNEAEAHSAVQLYRERFGTVGLYENEVYEGIHESLAEFARAGHRMVVATSKPRIYAVRIIEHFQLQGYFEHIYGSELDGHLSDKAELISHVLDSEKFDTNSTLIIGDRLHDIAGARANGIRSVGVLWGFGSHEELSGAGATTLCNSPWNLTDCVRL
ncbi:MAG: HAD hydrolase-like protein [Halioglobus sp.]|nr:HAD hydrolase-like protein [Halioglobus sp.]